MNGAALVLLREALRHSRRPGTWWMRVFLVSVCAFILWTGLSGATASRASDFAWIGRRLFRQWDVVQFGLVFAITPLVVASGIQEERTDRTLDILLLTPILPGRLLWGKVWSRLLPLLIALAGTIPLLSIIPTLGGVHPYQAVNMVAGHFALAVLLATIAGALTPMIRGGPLQASILTWILGGILCFVTPWPYVTGGERLILMAGSEIDSISGLLILALWLPAIAVTMHFGSLAFTIAMVDDSEGFGDLSPAVWRLERLNRSMWVVALLSGALYFGSSWVGFGAPTFRFLPAVGWNAAITFGLVQTAHSLLHRTSRDRLRNRDRDTARGRQPRFGALPMFWHHIRRSARLQMLALPMLLGGMFLLGTWALSRREIPVLVLGGYVLAVWIGGLQGANTGAVERDARSRDLFALAGLQPGSIALQQALVTGARALPLLLLLTLAWNSLESIPLPHRESKHHWMLLMEGAWWPRPVLATGIALTAAITSSNIAHALALTVPRRIVWISALTSSTLIVAGWLPFAIFLDEVLHIDTPRWMIAIWTPAFNEHVLRCDRLGVPASWPTSLLFWSLMAWATGWVVKGRYAR